MNKSEQKKKNSKMVFNNLTQIKPNMSCKKAQNTMS